MRKIMSLSIAAMVALFAIGTWATATTTSREQISDSGYRIDVFQMMSSATDLPSQQYDAF
jgi:hypothetical protein